MTRTIVMVGAPGSGKTTLAGEIQKIFGLGIRIISPVDIQVEHPEYENSNHLIFSRLRFKMSKVLEADLSVICDATNAIPEYRRPLLKVAQQNWSAPVAVWLDTPVKLCLERVFNRPPDIRQVDLIPEGIERMAAVIQRHPPSLNEGFGRVFQVRPNEPFPFDQL